ncbi:MAG: methyltransferase [Alphaproteobacteria bacterium]|nr:methyltransferase [Alphaproteobacteria bacterium]
MPNRRPPSRPPARSPSRPSAGRPAGGRPASRPQQDRPAGGHGAKPASGARRGSSSAEVGRGGRRPGAPRTDASWIDEARFERRSPQRPTSSRGGEAARPRRGDDEDWGFADRSPRGRRSASPTNDSGYNPNSRRQPQPRRQDRRPNSRYDDAGYADFGHDIGDYDFRDDYDIRPAGYDEDDRGFDPRPRRAPPAASRESGHSSFARAPINPDPTPPRAQPQSQLAGTLLRLPAGLAPLADRRLRRLPAPTFWLKQKDYDLLFLPRTPYKPTMSWPFLSQALECLIYGRFKVSDQQLEQLAIACRRRAKLWSLQLTVDGNHFVRQSWERWLIKALSDHGLRVVPAGTPAAAKAETLFVMAVEDAYYIGVQRFQADQLPHRAARTAERAGSLPHEIAGAMVELAYLQPGERLLDPVCGTGTLLIEAAAVQSDLVLHGYDVDHRAIQAASKNLATIANPAQLELSVVDSREPRLPPASIDVILANLPFGVQFGDTATNQALYESFFAAWAPLLSQQGRMVVLTADQEALNGALKDTPASQRRLRLDRKLRVRVKGIWAEIALLKL